MQGGEDGGEGEGTCTHGEECFRVFECMHSDKKSVLVDTLAERYRATRRVC